MSHLRLGSSICKHYQIFQHQALIFLESCCLDLLHGYSYGHDSVSLVSIFQRFQKTLGFRFNERMDLFSCVKWRPDRTALESLCMASEKHPETGSLRLRNHAKTETRPALIENDSPLVCMRGGTAFC